MRLLHVFMIAASSAFWDGPKAEAQTIPSYDTGRKMTPAETRLAHAFFGNDLELRYLDINFKHVMETVRIPNSGNTSPMLLYTSTAIPKNGAETVSTYDCSDPKRQHCQLSQFIVFNFTEEVKDFAAATGYEFATFFHEMTHVWQHQKTVDPKKISRQKEKKDQVYPYRLDSLSRFSDFGIEQQAAMVGDYARCFMLLQPQRPVRHIGKVTPEKLEILRQVVESKFPGAAALRLETETKRREIIERKMARKQARLNKKLKGPLS